MTQEQKATKLKCVELACSLVSQPVHALAATPQNIVALANTFYMYVEGIEAEQQELTGRAQSVVAGQTEMVYA